MAARLTEANFKTVNGGITLKLPTTFGAEPAVRPMATSDPTSRSASRMDKRSIRGRSAAAAARDFDRQRQPDRWRERKTVLQCAR
jgi:hypothetical protein